MSGREPRPKGRQINLRVDPDTERDLNELRSLASTKLFEPNLTDILRAVIKAGVPVVRAELLSSAKAPTDGRPAGTASDAQAPSATTGRKKRKA